MLALNIVLLTLENLALGTLMDDIVYLLVEAAVYGLLLWRIWRVGRITYLLGLPALLVAGAFVYLSPSSDYLDGRYAPFESLIISVDALTFFGGLLLCFAPVVWHHVLDGRTLFRRGPREQVANTSRASPLPAVVEPSPPPQMSPDGRWWWNGEVWLATSPDLPASSVQSIPKSPGDDEPHAATGAGRDSEDSAP